MISQGFIKAPVRQFVLAMTLLAGIFLFAVKPLLVGDAEEYAAMTIALADHASPDIRIADLEKAQVLLPEFANAFASTIEGIRAQQQVPKPGFFLGQDNKYYAIHFFAYSALAAIPFKALEATGLPPFKCFQIVNLAFLMALGLILLKVFNSPAKASIGIALFMLTGGMLYLNWSSTEFMSATSLLGSMMLFASGAPLLGGLMAGLAATQNPTIVFYLAFAPLLSMCIHSQPQLGWRVNLANVLRPRMFMGLGIGGALAALPILFNFTVFGVPSIIAKISTDPALMSLMRLHSFFFDISQGMIIGIPGVVLVLAFWLVLDRSSDQTLKYRRLVIALSFLTLVMAVPTLMVHNWNSGSQGMARYAFWGSMPVLFALLWYLSKSPRWPKILVLCTILIQFGAMLSAISYRHIEFSPLATWILKYLPEAYNPEPEIFAERLWHREGDINNANIYILTKDDLPSKIMYNLANSNVNEQLCGKGSVLALNTKITEADRSWRYISGTPNCIVEEGLKLHYTLPDFLASVTVKLGSGWSAPEQSGGQWDGVWSDGTRSNFKIAMSSGTNPKSISLVGHYLSGNSRTRVSINGKDHGWLKLDQMPVLRLATDHVAELKIELEHEAPHSPGPADARQLAYFMTGVKLQ